MELCLVCIQSAHSSRVRSCERPGFSALKHYNMQHECRITVLETKVFPELQEKYLADPKSGPCPCFKAGDTFLLKRTPQQDDFYHLMNGKFCGEAWDAVSRYVYTALQITVPNKSHFLDTVTNAITKGVIKKYNKPSDKNIQLNELGIKLSKLAKKEG